MALQQAPGHQHSIPLPSTPAHLCSRMQAHPSVHWAVPSPTTFSPPTTRCYRLPLTCLVSRMVHRLQGSSPQVYQHRLLACWEHRLLVFLEHRLLACWVKARLQEQVSRFLLHLTEPPLDRQYRLEGPWEALWLAHLMFQPMVSQSLPLFARDLGLGRTRSTVGLSVRACHVASHLAMMAANNLHVLDVLPHTYL